MLRTSTSVLSTIQASAADIVQSQGYLSITGVPRMKYSQIANAGFGYTVKLAEVLGSITVTPTVSVGIPSTLVITQYVGALGRNVTEVVSYTPVTGDTATIVCNAWRAQLALYNDLRITSSGTATFIVAATATTNANSNRAAIISVTSTSGTNTVAQTQAAQAITGVTVATETLLLTAATTGAVAGGIIAVSGVAGATNVNGVFIIGTVVASTSIGLKDFYTGVDIANGGAWSSGGFWVLGSVPYVASTTSQTQGGQSRGQYWDLVAVGVDASLLTSGKTYNQAIFQYFTREGGAIVETAISQHTLYVQSDATNFAAFATRIGEIMNDYTASAVTADPKNAAVV